ncbi:PAS domain-containing protein [Zunongwangia sp. H14]|uniref:PAS domain-containing protein n=1 Tax=Zunongwangia sp. H14 TaxID=3240792 RepID=UPI003563BE6F
MNIEELRTIFRMFPLASVVLERKADKDYHISLLNEKFSGLLRLEESQLHGANLFSEKVMLQFPCLRQNSTLLIDTLQNLEKEAGPSKLSCTSVAEGKQAKVRRNSYEIELKKIPVEGSDAFMILMSIEDKTRDLQEQTEGKKAKNYLDNLINSLPGVAYRCKVDEHWTMTFLSPKVKELTGYPASDFLKNEKRSFSSIIFPEDLEITYQALDQIQQKNFFRIKYRLQRADGTLTWVEEQGTGVYSSKGELLYIDGVIVDITNKIRQDQEIEENNRRYQALVQEGSDLISIVDKDANFIFASESNRRILGISPSELIDENAFNFIHPKDKERIYAGFLELQKTKQVRPLPFRFRAKNNQWKWLECIATNLTDDPAVKGYVINSRDITREFLQKEELAKANEQFRLAKKATNDALWDLDLINNKLEWGEGYRHIFGYKTTTRCYDLNDAKNYTRIYPEDFDRVIHSLKQAVNATECQVWKEKYRYLRADHSVAIVSNRAYIIRDNKGRAVRLVGALQDITEEENRQEQGKLLNGIKTELQCCKHPGEGFMQMLQFLCRYNGADAGELWLTSSNGEEIHNAARMATSNAGKLYMENKDYSKNSILNKSLYGKLISENSLFWNAQELDKSIGKNPGFSSANGIPLISSGEIIGVLCFFYTATKYCSTRTSEVLQAINEDIALSILHKKKDEELANFFNLSREILCIGNWSGKLLRINPAVHTVLGYTAEEVVQKSVMDFIYPEDLDNTKSDLIALREQDADFNFEARFLHKNGKAVWISWTTAAVKEENLVYAVGKDITASKHAALQLQESTEKLEYAQSIAKLGYWYRNIEDNISEWSKTTYKIFERSPKTFVPSMENVTRAFHPQDRELLKATLPPNQFKDFEHRILTSRGKVKWVFQRIKMVTNAEGKPLMLEGIIQDITEKKEKDLQVKVSNERYKIAMKATEEMIWDWDLATDKVNRSKSYQKIFGYKNCAATTLQDFWFKNVHPEDREAVKTSISQALKSKSRKKWKMHYRFYKANGDIAFVSDKAFIVRDENKKAVRVVGAARDVTRSRLMIQEIQQQNKLLKEITWMQSHKVRAPLSRILSLINLLPEINTGKEQNEFLDYLSQSAEELDDVIRQVISKTESLC